MSPSKLLSQKVLLVVLVTAYFCVCLIAWQQSLPSKFDVYTVGEWLINYGGGFTRRGLAGSLVISVAHLFNITPEFVVFVVKAVCFGMIYLGVVLLVRGRLQAAYVDWLLLVSPCTFLFPILDRWGGGRKEILLLALLTSLALWIRAGRRLPSMAWISGTLLILTFVHEGLFFFYPLVLTGVALIAGQAPYRWSKMILILLPSGAALCSMALLQPPVTDVLIDAMVRRIDPKDFAQWNNGAIETLKYTLSQGMANVRVLIDAWALTSLFIGWLVSMAPLYWIMSRPHFADVKARYGRTLMLAMCCQLPLYVIATDWGRWIYVNASLLTIIYVALPQAKTKLLDKAAETQLTASTQATTLSKTWPLLALVVLTVVWASHVRIPHCCVLGFQFH